MPKLSSSETIYNEVVKRCEFEFERAKHLDDKASSTLGFLGILASLISGFGGLSLQTPTNYLGTVHLLLFTASLGFLFLSFIYSLRAYQIKKYTIVPDAYFLIGKYESKEKGAVIKELCDNYAIAIEENMKLNDEKSKNVKRSLWLMLLAIITFSLFAFSKILSG